MRYDPHRCTREYRHGPHTYNAVGVAEPRACPGRRRRPVRAMLMWAEALAGLVVRQ